MQHTSQTNEPMDSKQNLLEERERRDELIAYFDLAWEIFVRLEKEGALGKSGLTNPKLNPTVKPPIDFPKDQPNKST